MSYGHVFKDVTGQYLFIRPLGTGVSCQAQLVRHLPTGEYRVRKVLHRRVPIGEELPRNIRYTVDADIQAIIQFNNEAAIVDLLQKSTERNQPKIATLYSHSTQVDEKKRKYTRVSYWSLSNGGDLDSFLADYQYHLPRPFILRFLSQILTTLQHLYTACHDRLGPIVHNDLHAGNILLHYPSNAPSPIPEFHLIDFGLATPLSPAFIADDNDFLLPTPGNPPDWDVPRVLRIVDKLLATWPEEHRAFLHSGGDPIGSAYRLLLDLDRRFQDLLLQHRRHIHETTDLSQRLTLPDLRPVIGYVNSSLATLDPQGVEMRGHQLVSQAYLNFCEPEFRAPMTYSKLNEIGHAKGLPGPWHIGYLDPDRNYQVLDLLAVGNKETFHRPNEDNTNSDSDSAWGDD
ncbi:kinase-like domain-containing protein [Cercophora samala]|uniref:Kinase-like domain-containing protein n=1 Tax=Cercophora samala TaxID=330535 RepID=A0AA39ZBG3_9PEZI|nr:kinase-like domain-containing protein [Cercophora samala]